MDAPPPRKRIRHFDGEGHARELTFSCFQRKPFFSKPYVCEWFFKELAKARLRHPIHIWAYVVMPEHVHLLVWPAEPDCSISDLLETVKSSVSKRAHNHLLKHNPKILDATDGEFHFWQAGPGYDRNLEHPGSVWTAIDYIHLNPVRRGLCLRTTDWRWSSAGFFADQGEAPFPIDRESLPEDPRQ
jgi:putative transposase